MEDKKYNIYTKNNFQKDLDDNDELENSVENNGKDNIDKGESHSNKLEDVLNKMKNNINKMKIYKPVEKSNKKNKNNIDDNNIIKNNNIINNNENIITKQINNDNINININSFDNNNNNNFNNNINIEELITKEKDDKINIHINTDITSNHSIKKKDIQSNNNNINNDKEKLNEQNIIDKNLNINENINMNQELKNIKLENKTENKNISILQNLKGISNQNANFGSTLMSNVSYSSFLSFKNKKVKFVNLNSSINQSLINKSRQEELKKQEEADKEKINEKENEKIMKTILERLGGGGVINENANEESSIKKNITENNSNSDINKNLNEDSSENESLLFNISKQYALNKNNNKENIEQKETGSTKTNSLDKIEKKIRVNIIKCTLSFLDKGKAIFVTENDDIFSLPSSILNENIKVGNSYMFQIDKLNDHLKKLYEIENIQNKYNKWES